MVVRLKQKLRGRISEAQMRLEPVAYLGDVHAKHGNFVVWNDSPPTVMVVGNELSQEVFSKRSFHNSTLRGPKGSGLEILLNGLVFLNGNPHKDQRRLIAPAFHKEAVHGYFRQITEVATRVIDGIEANEVTDALPVLTDFTFRVTLRCLFGIDDDFGALGGKINNWVKLLTNPLSYLLPFNTLGLPYQKLLERSDELVEATAQILQHLRQSSDSSIMSALLNARDEEGKGLSDEELIGHINLIFLAGHETSRNALGFMLYLLAQHPEITERLRNDICEATADGFTLESISKLDSLTHAIWESMRLLPPTAWMDKYAAEDVEIAGEKFPKGTMVVLFHYMNHRDPEIYPEPNRFNPERWQTTKPPSYSFVPFGGGFRMCIGSEFAMMEMRVILALLLTRYSFVLEDGQKLDRLIRATMRVKGEMKMRFVANGRFKRANIKGQLAQMVDTNA
jgi:cytochrome P450